MVVMRDCVECECGMLDGAMISIYRDRHTRKKDN